MIDAVLRRFLVPYLERFRGEVTQQPSHPLVGGANLLEAQIGPAHRADMIGESAECFVLQARPAEETGVVACRFPAMSIMVRKPSRGLCCVDNPSGQKASNAGAPASRLAASTNQSRRKVRSQCDIQVHDRKKLASGSES
jgi:hypothetical protein